MMTDIETPNLSGLLIERPRAFIERKELIRSNKLTFVGTIEGSAWEEFLFISEEPLRGEVDIISNKPFEYRVICRRSGPRILLMSETRKIVENILQNLLCDMFFPKPLYVPIAVDDLVKSITLHPTIFALSFVHARMPAFGSSLRAISFYGEDLGDATIFRDNVELMNCFTCGLRSAAGGREILRLGTDGAISFSVQSTNRFFEVENTLKYLRKEGHLQSPILDVD